MIEKIRMQTDCIHVAEYVDEGEVPTDAKFDTGKFEQPETVTEYVDEWSDGQPSASDLSWALLELVQKEEDAPSRARIVESIVRLQAVDALRKILAQPASKDPSLHNQAVQAIARIFASNDSAPRELTS